MDIPPPRPYGAARRGGEHSERGTLSDIDADAAAAAAQSGDILTERHSADIGCVGIRQPESAAAIDDDKRSGNCDFTRHD